MDQKDVPYIVFESVTTKLERTIEKLWILAIILVLLLVGTNAGWLYYESQFKVEQTTMIEAEQDGAGVNVIGGEDVNYGAEGKDNQN